MITDQEMLLNNREEASQKKYPVKASNGSKSFDNRGEEQFDDEELDIEKLKFAKAEHMTEFINSLISKNVLRA